KRCAMTPASLLKEALTQTELDRRRNTPELLAGSEFGQSADRFHIESLNTRWLLLYTDRFALRSRHLSDSQISGDDQLAGAQRSLFKIRSVGSQQLPSCDFFSEHLNRAHGGKFC